MAHHHCGCKLLPADFEARLQANSLVPDHTIPYVLACAGLAPAKAAVRRQRQHFDAVDPRGHMRYLGRMPASRAQPLLTLNGERVPASRYAMAVFGGFDPGPDAALTRDITKCREHDCFAPAHFIARMPQEPVAAQPFAELEPLYEARFGKCPNPRPSSWDRADVLHPRCFSGHPLQTYGLRDGRNRSYCPTCATASREWTRQHREWSARLQAYGPEPVEAYLVHLWTSDEDVRPELGSLWQMLDDWYLAHPDADVQPSEAHARMLDDQPIDWDKMFEEMEASQGQP